MRAVSRTYVVAAAMAMAALWLARRGPAAHVTLFEPLACPTAVLVDGRLSCRGGPVELGLRAGDTLERVSGHRGRMAPADLAALSVRLDPNRASAAELTSLPGVGPVTAGRIVEGRPYGRVEDLARVRGIGTRRLETMRARLELEL